MWMSYGRRAPIRALPEAVRLDGIAARVGRWAAPIAIAVLFVYPNPLVPVALAVLAACAVVQVVRGHLAQAGPLDAWMGLFALGTLGGLAIAHNADAATLRFTGIAGAVATFFALRSALVTEAAIRRAALALLLAVVGGILVVLGLLRGSLPDSTVARALLPLTAPFAAFPGVSGDTLDVNARFTVHQYGLAHLLLVAAMFAASAVALGTRRRVIAAGVGGLLVTIPFLLATQARGAFLAFAFAATAVAFHRTRVALVIPPLAAGALYVLLARGTISRGVELAWLDQRLGYWSGTLSILGDFPLLGAGLGVRTFAETFSWYHQLPDPYQVSHTHNIFVQAYAEQGLAGCLGLAGLLVLGSAIGMRAVRRTAGRDRWLVGAAMGGLLGSTVYGLTDQVPSTNLSLALVFALLAVVGAADRLGASTAAPLPSAMPVSRLGPSVAWRSPRRWLLSGLLLAILAAGGLALAPRWIGGVYLNLGSADLMAAVLDPSRTSDARAARLASANRWLEMAVAANPGSVDALRNLGWARLLRNDLPGAKAAIEGAYRPDAGAFDRAQLARLANEAGAIELTIRLLKEGADEPRLKSLADQLMTRRRWHDAALAYAALAELHPDEAEYISNFAKAVLAGGGDDGEALRALLQAVSQKPEAARNLARQLVLEGEPYRSREKLGGGNFEQARFWFTLASQVDPTYDRPEVELGSLHYYRGRYGEALTHFTEASRRDPKNSSTFNQLGETYLALGLIEDGLASYKRAVDLRPDRAELHLDLARAYLSVGRREEALRTLWAASERFPNNTLVRDELARIEAGE
ncbi:MAG: tetratricopeptide repeat protein [Chloroflexi bacterium]|nr:tetratricopeptide repeat protein [Chloroflexota bacterium]